MKNEEHNSFRKKIPWPTKEAMIQVYEMKLWGRNDSDFYSGDGSHQSDIVEPYLEVLTSFLKSFKTPPVVCDLGCGDFNVGKNLFPFTKNYIAVDIVPDLISYNREKFKFENLEFQCLDIAEDDLPPGDIAVLRQVLQHLSNSEIQRILHKLVNYQYIVLTEHLPTGDFTPNEDIISGQGIRLKKQSGVDILAAPFNFKVLESEQVLSVELKNDKGVISTSIYKMF